VIKDTLEPVIFFLDPLCYRFIWLKLVLLLISSEALLFPLSIFFALESSLTLKLILSLSILEVSGRLICELFFFNALSIFWSFLLF
jgi:hypothetical protein